MQALFLQILSLALCTNGAENLQTSLQAFVLQKQIVNCIDLVALGTNAGNALFSGYKRIPPRNSTKSAADYSAFPGLLLLCSSAVLQIDASPVPELTNRLGWAELFEG